MNHTVEQCGGCGMEERVDGEFQLPSFHLCVEVRNRGGGRAEGEIWGARV